MTLTLSDATTERDFDAAHALLGQMADWDIAMTTAMSGPQAAAVVPSYYPDRTQLRANYTRPGAALLLAWQGGQAVGCLGFGPISPTTAEVQKFYVADPARGQGAGNLLMRALLPRMAAAGYSRAVLETASFMSAAIALYRAQGFQPCPPFRPALDDLSLFMDRAL